MQTPTDNRVTIRERDSMQQIRVGIIDALPIISQLSQGQKTWAEVFAANEAFTA